MATPKTRNQKFDWSKHDIQELKKEYFQIGMTDFTIKYKVGRGPVIRELGEVPDHIKKEITCKKMASLPRNRKKSERFENTTKVAKLYEKKMSEIQPPKYTGPWSEYIKF